MLLKLLKKMLQNKATTAAGKGEVLWDRYPVTSRSRRGRFQTKA